jgi:hypothetical protein
MIFHKHIPKFPLGNYVDCIVYVESNNKGILTVMDFGNGIPKKNN